jgi:hypothetical protein
MKCPRCAGPMNFEEFRSVSSESGPWTYDGWRCVYCGEIVDALVILNRERARKARSEEGEGREKKRPERTRH